MTDDFFQADPDGKIVYTDRQNTYQAPEQIMEFQPRFIATFPGTDRRIAFGFVRWSDQEGWKDATGMEQERWDSGRWAVKETVDVPRETSQPDAPHVHDYSQTLGSWPSGPDGETASLKACACGAQITEEDE
jgi:hypothetical protein